MAVDQDPFTVPLADQMQAHEGRQQQIEARGPITFEQRRELQPLLFVRQAAPVVPLNGQGRLPTHDLQRFLDTLPHERRTEHRMALNHQLPGSLKGVEPQVARQPVDILVEIGVRRRVGEAVIEQSLLQRGQIVHGFDLWFIAHGSVPWSQECCRGRPDRSARPENPTACIPRRPAHNSEQSGRTTAADRKPRASRSSPA
ncbi:MAG: hypothetical protein UZ03_NOB001002154 [Nitrospira sp. OLB3]|nr:MAG: hypothetical protein UZ03_NOB001002154 [Nitrospira sp. OLB3]